MKHLSLGTLTIAYLFLLSGVLKAQDKGTDELQKHVEEARIQAEKRRIGALVEKYSNYSKEIQKELLKLENEIHKLRDTLEVEKAAFELARSKESDFGFGCGVESAQRFAEEACTGDRCGERFVLYKAAFTLARTRSEKFGFDYSVESAMRFANEQVKEPSLEKWVAYKLSFELARTKDEEFGLSWGVDSAQRFAKDTLKKKRPLIWIDAYTRAFRHARKDSSSGGLGFGVESSMKFAESRADRAVEQLTERERTKK